jgi:hypothetical protein
MVAMGDSSGTALAAGRFAGSEPLGFEAGDSNLYRFVANGPTEKTDPSGQTEWRLDLSGHGGPHIQFGNFRWDAATLRPIGHLGEKNTPPPLTEQQLRSLAKSGVLKRLAKNIPDSVVKAAADEVLEQGIKACSKSGAKVWAKAVLQRTPILMLVFAGQDYAEGGWEKAAKNAVIPGELIEDVAKAAGDKFDKWLEEAQKRHIRKRFGALCEEDPVLRHLVE